MCYVNEVKEPDAAQKRIRKCSISWKSYEVHAVHEHFPPFSNVQIQNLPVLYKFYTGIFDMNVDHYIFK